MSVVLEGAVRRRAVKRARVVASPLPFALVCGKYQTFEVRKTDAEPLPYTYRNDKAFSPGSDMELSMIARRMCSAQQTGVDAVGAKASEYLRSRRTTRHWCAVKVSNARPTIKRIGYYCNSYRAVI